MAYRIAASRQWMGNDGPWSTFSIRVGSPPQSLEVLPASSATLSLVVLEQGCSESDPANCRTLRGNVLDTGNLSTWEPLVSDSGERYLSVLLPAQQAVLNEQIASEMAINSISLDVWGGDSANSVFLKHQLLAGYAVKTPFIGLLGLSGRETYPVRANESYESPLQTLKNTGTISGLTWAYTAGAQYKVPKSYGSLTFGGFDSSLVDMDNAMTGVDFTKDANQNELTLNINSITIGGTVAGDTDMLALLDTMVPDIWLPKSVCDVFEDRFGLRWNETFGMYLVSDEQRTRLRAENTNVSFHLTPTYDSPKAISITLPYLAFDHEAKFPLAGIEDDNTTLYYFPLKRTPNDTTNFLGRTFFQEA